MELVQRCTDKAPCLCPPGLCEGWLTEGLCFFCRPSSFCGYSCESSFNCAFLYAACTTPEKSWTVPLFDTSLSIAPRHSSQASSCMVGFLTLLFKCNPTIPAASVSLLWLWSLKYLSSCWTVHSNRLETIHIRIYLKETVEWRITFLNKSIQFKQFH